MFSEMRLSRWIDLDRPAVQRTIVWGSLLVLYEIAARAAGDFYLPTVGQVVTGIIELVQAGHALTLLTSLRQMIVGYALAVVVGIVLGLLMGRMWLIDQVAGMFLRILLVTSLAALLPVIIVIVGFEFQFRVVVVFLFSFMFITLSTASGARNIDPLYLEMARAFNTPRLRQFIDIVLPASLPFILSGLRLGLLNAFSGMVLAELWVVRDTGALLQALSLNRDLPKLFALVLVVTLMATLAASLLRRAERRIAPWANVEAT